MELFRERLGGVPVRPVPRCCLEPLLGHLPVLGGQFAGEVGERGSEGLGLLGAAPSLWDVRHLCEGPDSPSNLGAPDPSLEAPAHSRKTVPTDPAQQDPCRTEGYIGGLCPVPPHCKSSEKPLPLHPGEDEQAEPQERGGGRGDLSTADQSAEALPQSRESKPPRRCGGSGCTLLLERPGAGRFLSHEPPGPAPVVERGAEPVGVEPRHAVEHGPSCRLPPFRVLQRLAPAVENRLEHLAAAGGHSKAKGRRQVPVLGGKVGRD
mmetsp:Transcript_27166/g.79144  ORF Transcript_27166/g.79144 Transcript_27166/m.79144 type:complete len:264 (-) Transcript_27166:3988-4779(-)